MSGDTGEVEDCPAFNFGGDPNGVASGILGRSSLFFMEEDDFPLVVGGLISKPSVSRVMKTLSR